MYQVALVQALRDRADAQDDTPSGLAIARTLRHVAEAIIAAHTAMSDE